MAPSPTPGTLCAARRRPSPRALAAAMTLVLAAWLTATPARCVPTPSIARLAAAATLTSPAWSWLQLLRSTLPGGSGSAPAPHAASTRRANAILWHGIGSAGSTAADTDGSSGDGSGSNNCATDPNGCKPGP